MIDEKVLIERLEEYKYSHLVEHDKERLEHCTENESTEHCEGIDCFWCVWDKSISIVNQLAEEHNNGWISCSGRLPNEGQTVIAQVTREYQLNLEMETPFCIMKYEKDFLGYNWKLIEFDNWFKDEVVIAWQPLPAPYKGEQK